MILIISQSNEENLKSVRVIDGKLKSVSKRNLTFLTTD